MSEAITREQTMDIEESQSEISFSSLSQSEASFDMDLGVDPISENRVRARQTGKRVRVSCRIRPPAY
jgi:hypothetical protein